MLNIIFLGAPGSGKGTQSVLLAKNLNIPNISTGEILRKEVSDSSAIGLEAKSYMDSGKLVPDEVVVGIIKKRISLEDCQKGFILDGFPRNLPQGEMLEGMLSDIGNKIDLVFDIDVPDDFIVKRITGRFSCKGCGAIYNKFFKIPQQKGICDGCGSDEFESRKDDDEETIVNRLAVYNQNTAQLVEFYRKKDLLNRVDGLKPISSISGEISKICLNSLK